MAYSYRQRILIFLFITTFFITLISGQAYWKFWSVVPITFGILYIIGKYTLLKEYTTQFILIVDVNKIMFRYDVHER